MTGSIVKHSAADVKVNRNPRVLHEGAMRQLKARVRGGNSYTLVHTVTLPSYMELVLDMCPEMQKSIYGGYN
ncbi:MAG: hypothetical protein ACKPKO_51730, partial [Candidatus Fonsibacter sp.]